MQGKRTAVYCRVDRGGNSEMRRDALEMVDSGVFVSLTFKM